MKREVFHKETTTDGRTLYYVSTGPGTGDVEVIEEKREDEPRPMNWHGKYLRWVFAEDEA